MATTGSAARDRRNKVAKTKKRTFTSFSTAPVATPATMRHTAAAIKEKEPATSKVWEIFPSTSGVIRFLLLLRVN